MMRRLTHVLLCSMVLCSVYTISSFADEWVLAEIPVDDCYSSVSLYSNATSSSLDVDDEEWEDDEIELINDLATISNWDTATSSNAGSDYGIMLLSNYSGVYDGTMSSTYVNYARDTVSKFTPGEHYVFFRPSQYKYRLVYGSDLELSGSVFTGTALQYIEYDSRYYTVSYGVEGDFSLTTNGYLVYTDLQGLFPTLDSGVRNYEFKTLLFVAVVYLLYLIAHSFFSVGKYRI